MNDSKVGQEKWKSESMRDERKARLAAMKAKDGGKKPVKTSNPLARIIIVIVLVLALIGSGIWLAIGYGLPQQYLTAVTIGSARITPVELNYYYHSLAYNYYGIDVNAADSAATLASATGVEEFPTLAEYLKDQAAQQIQNNVMLEANAKAEGINLTDEDQATIDSFFANLTTSASTSGTGLDSYLASMYGKGATIKALQPVLARYLLATRYATEKAKTFTSTDEEIQTYYDANKDTVDQVDYRYFVFTSAAAADASDEDTKTAMAAAKTKADAMLAAVTDGESFREQCILNAAEADKESYQTADKSLNKGVLQTGVSYPDLATWLFDAARVAGDKTEIEISTGYVVAMFEARAKPDYKLVNVRHILISAAADTATDEEIAAAKAKAESILAEYEAGDKTEASFGELAKTNSSDGNAAEGGIYEDVDKGAMVETFNDWIYDQSRQPGDTGIVQTDYGFHIMYFVGLSDRQAWQATIATTLQNDQFAAFTEAQLKFYPYELNSLGMRFTT